MRQTHVILGLLLPACASPLAATAPDPWITAPDAMIATLPPPPWASRPPVDGDPPDAGAWWSDLACYGDKAAYDLVKDQPEWWTGCSDLPLARCAELTRAMQQGASRADWEILAGCDDDALEAWFSRKEAPDDLVVRWFAFRGGPVSPRVLEAVQSQLSLGDPSALAPLYGVDAPAVAALVTRLWKERADLRGWLAATLLAQSDPRAKPLQREVCGSVRRFCDDGVRQGVWAAAHPLEDLDRTIGSDADLGRLVREHPQFHTAIAEGLARCVSRGIPRHRSACLHALAIADRKRAADLAVSTPDLEEDDLVAALRSMPDPASWERRLAALGLTATPGAVTPIEALAAADRAIPLDGERGEGGSAALLRELALRSGWKTATFAAIDPRGGRGTGVLQPRTVLYAWDGTRRYRLAVADLVAAVGLFNRMAADDHQPDRAALTEDRGWVALGTPQELASWAKDDFIRWDVVY